MITISTNKSYPLSSASVPLYPAPISHNWLPALGSTRPNIASHPRLHLPLITKSTLSNPKSLTLSASNPACRSISAAAPHCTSFSISMIGRGLVGSTSTPLWVCTAAGGSGRRTGRYIQTAKHFLFGFPRGSVCGYILDFCRRCGDGRIFSQNACRQN